jgi:hypothetical protein
MDMRPDTNWSQIAQQAFEEELKKPNMPTKTTQQEFTGTLEVDLKRGVMYFHADEGQSSVPTILRICNLGPLKPLGDNVLDITYGHGHSHKLKP